LARLIKLQIKLIANEPSPENSEINVEDV